ncbi:uncharacterized protein LOC103495319 [Cucumis melo]|uniref:Uncharacterized protein LOC103495319 n=1 Tax=Cucumis melo TaxID=3656 RepID=A0A1S3C176_CUCME|nr:uncharacterized protein LOC103495319 [Cucumis melo]
MSSIGQSILMALAVTLNKFASSNVQSVQRNKATATVSSPIGRRDLLLSTVAPAAAAAAAVDSRTELLKRYLKKSEENKEKNDKERLESYYKRNYKDYFEFVEGSVKNKNELSEAEKGIVEWLKRNK